MADALKEAGNKAFQAKDYDKAIELFSQALEIDPTNFVLWSNRSAAKAGKREWAAALEDAEQVRDRDRSILQEAYTRAVVCQSKSHMAKRLREERRCAAWPAEIRRGHRGVRGGLEDRG